MVRFVVSPDGAIAPDLFGKLPGRGAWVSADRGAVNEAVKKGAFARSLKMAAPAAAGLADLVEAGLARIALDSLGLARRTGDAALGLEKASALMRAGKAAVLVVAKDAGRDGRDKLRPLARDIQICDLFSAEELSQALGRDVVYGAVASGPHGGRFLRAEKRLRGFRPSPDE